MELQHLNPPCLQIGVRGHIQTIAGREVLIGKRIWGDWTASTYSRKEKLCRSGPWGIQILSGKQGIGSRTGDGRHRKNLAHFISQPGLAPETILVLHIAYATFTETQCWPHSDSEEWLFLLMAGAGNHFALLWALTSIVSPPCWDTGVTL
jgi:hypothetical protein